MNKNRQGKNRIVRKENFGKTLKKLGLDIGCDVIGGIFYAMGIVIFAKNAHFAPGGISGLALIANHLWGLPIGIVTLMLNLPLVLISFRVVGREFLLRTARTMLITTVFLDVIFPLFPASLI